MWDEEEQHRIRTAKRMAHKLAHNRSRGRSIRRLPQSMIVVPRNGLRRAYPGREALHRNKRLAYIMLLGASLCAYMYDVDVDTLGHVLNLVSMESKFHIGEIISRS
jgi:hypothetical protein